MRALIALSLLFFAVSSCREPVAEAKLPPVDSTPLIFSQINGTQKQLDLDTFFQRRFVDGRFSGCVLVAQRGIVLYKKAYGWADYEKRDSLKISHSFQLASVSKQFTAAAIMLLQQQGKLSYDDTAGKYIPGFPYHHVTIRQLLTHRAGLDKYTNICDNYYRERNCEPTAFSNDSALAIMEALHVRPFRRPDTKFEYSNTGYMILALIAEKVSGKPFHRFMQDEFFTPLGMNHTWVANDGKEHDEKTKGYFGKWKWWNDNFLDGVTGDKGVFSSVEDMFIWDRALRNGTILKTNVQQEAFKAYSADLEGKEYWNYGFGWRTIAFDDGAMAVFHNGWWHGYTSAFYRGLTDDVTIIILCNKFNKGIYNMRPILEILGAHTVAMPGEEEETDTAPATKETPVPGKKKS